ncbi:MAG TPA: hypothetical protein VI643_04290, partial [Planctomycetota bacterium]|nr:hypothetical protein [Planctomycetota bacterium]
RRALGQLDVGMRAVGLGLDVVPIESAAIRPPWICLFAPEQVGWQNLSTVLGDGAAPASERWRLLEAFARFCRRLHDAGFYNPDQGLSHFHARVRPSSQDFQVAELDGASIVDPMPDAARERMLGAVLVSTRDSLGNGMRFLRAYADSDDIAREVAPRVMRGLALRFRPPPKPKNRRAKLGRLRIDPFDVEYIKKDTEIGIEARDLMELYSAGLQAPGLKVIRSGDVRSAWKSALTAGPGPTTSPLACFARRKDKAGFLLFRTRA